MTDWMTMQEANTLGAVLGAGFGIVGGGLGGPLLGYLVPRGKGKFWVISTMATMLVMGAGLLTAAVVAWAQKQPGFVIHPFMLAGTIVTAVTGGLIPAVLGGYRAAEQRRLSEAEFRRGRAIRAVRVRGFDNSRRRASSKEYRESALGF